jgi:pseudaminic acid cytidylyltransferase
VNVAILPARGGSKRIPGKNIRPFCGKPMIAWSIDAALQSGCFDRILVSTDDARIAEVARECGAEVPFVRPENLADDHAGTQAVVCHAVQWLREQGQEDGYACCIYATAPLLQPEYLRQGLNLLTTSGKTWVFSVATFPYPIQRALRRSVDGCLEALWPEHDDTRSQDLEETVHDAGQFYWGRFSAWCGDVPLRSPQALGLVLPRYLVQDIDTEEDWIQAERLFLCSRDKSLCQRK